VPLVVWVANSLATGGLVPVDPRQVILLDELGVQAEAVYGQVLRSRVPAHGILYLLQRLAPQAADLQPDKIEVAGRSLTTPACAGTLP
jgi:hypothetical protein